MLRVMSSRFNEERREIIVEATRPEDTENLGFLLAGLVYPGAVLSLSGDLGAGKTTLTRGFSKGLGCLGAVASPTFTLLMEHPAGANGLALYHFDVYRLDSSDAFYELGFDEYFDRDGVCIIEWGDRINDILPPQTIHLSLTRETSAESIRQITISSLATSDLLPKLGETINAVQEINSPQPKGAV